MSHSIRTGSEPEEMGARVGGSQPDSTVSHAGASLGPRAQDHLERVGEQLLTATDYAGSCNRLAEAYAESWRTADHGADGPSIPAEEFGRTAVLLAMRTAGRRFGSRVHELVGVGGTRVRIQARAVGADAEAEPWHGHVEWFVGGPGNGLVSCGPFQSRHEVDAVLATIESRASADANARDVFGLLERYGHAPVTWSGAVSDEEIRKEFYEEVLISLCEAAGSLTVTGTALPDAYGWGVFGALEAFLREFATTHGVDILSGGRVFVRWLDEADGRWVSGERVDPTDPTASVRVERGHRLHVWQVAPMTDEDDDNRWRGAVDGKAILNQATEAAVMQEAVAVATRLPEVSPADLSSHRADPAVGMLAELRDLVLQVGGDRARELLAEVLDEDPRTGSGTRLSDGGAA